MKLEKKLQVLKRIAKEFEQAGIIWAVGGSALLYLKEIVDTFADLDLMLDEKDVEKARDILVDMGIQKNANPLSPFTTRCFMKFQIEGVDIDVMAGFGLIYEGVEYYFPLKKEWTEEYDLAGVNIPLDSVREWETYYLYMGRNPRVKMIRTAVSQHLVLVPWEEKWRVQAEELLNNWCFGGDSTSSSIVNNKDEEYLRLLNGTIHQKEPRNSLTYFCLDSINHRFVGAVIIYHETNEEFLLENGHIDVGICLSEQNKGYVTKLIQLAVEQCFELGMDEVLLVCETTNFALRKAIVDNGGRFEKQFSFGGEILERFWIMKHEKDARDMIE